MRSFYISCGNVLYWLSLFVVMTYRDTLPDGGLWDIFFPIPNSPPLAPASYAVVSLIVGGVMAACGYAMSKPTTRLGTASPPLGKATLVKALPSKTIEPTNEELAEPVEPAGTLADFGAEPQWQQPPVVRSTENTRSAGSGDSLLEHPDWLERHWELRKYELKCMIKSEGWYWGHS